MERDAAAVTNATFATEPPAASICLRICPRSAIGSLPPGVKNYRPTAAYHRDPPGGSPPFPREGKRVRPQLQRDNALFQMPVSRTRVSAVRLHATFTSA